MWTKPRIRRMFHIEALIGCQSWYSHFQIIQLPQEQPIRVLFSHDMCEVKFYATSCSRWKKVTCTAFPAVHTGRRVGDTSLHLPPPAGEPHAMLNPILDIWPGRMEKDLGELQLGNTSFSSSLVLLMNGTKVRLSYSQKKLPQVTATTISSANTGERSVKHQVSCWDHIFQLLTILKKH